MHADLRNGHLHSEDFGMTSNELAMRLVKLSAHLEAVFNLPSTTPSAAPLLLPESPSALHASIKGVGIISPQDMAATTRFLRQHSPLSSPADHLDVSALKAELARSTRQLTQELQVLREEFQRTSVATRTPEKTLLKLDFLVGVALTLLILIGQSLENNALWASLQATLDLIIAQQQEAQQAQVRQPTASTNRPAAPQGQVFGSLGRAGPRGLAVRFRPSASSPVLARLLAGQAVQITATRGKWVRVAYYDQETDTTEAGWTLKKYVVRR